MGKTVLIVEDEQSIVDILSFNLTKEGYDTLEALDGPTGLQLALEQNPDLVLLDLMLPGLSGEAVLSHLEGVPVIVLSARAEVEDKVNLLRGGAADYLTKPFDTRELLARVAVQLRQKSPRDGLLRCRSFVLDPGTRETTVNGEPIRLTRTEFEILKFLMQNPKQVVTKSQLLDQLSTNTPDCVESSLKVHISNLRKKLREAGAGEMIEAVWGIGFKLAE